MKNASLELLAKYVSRKFLVTLAALFMLFGESSHLTTLQTIVIGAVAATYLIAEALVDHAGAKAPATIINNAPAAETDQASVDVVAIASDLLRNLSAEERATLRDDLFGRIARSAAKPKDGAA